MREIFSEKEYSSILMLGNPMREEAVRNECKRLTLNQLVDFMCIVHALAKETGNDGEKLVFNRLEEVVYSEALMMREAMTEEETKAWLKLSMFNTETEELN